MISHRIAVVVAVLALFVPLGAHAEDGFPNLAPGGSTLAPVGECEGFAPVSVACSFRGNMPAYSTVHLEAQPEFTGRIGLRIVTQTGSYTASCDFLGIDDPVCRSSTSGTLAIGQAFNAYGTASVTSPVDGSEIQRVAFGRWRVFLTSP